MAKGFHILHVNLDKLTLPKSELATLLLPLNFGLLSAFNRFVQFCLASELARPLTRRVTPPSSRAPKKRPQAPEVLQTSGRSPTTAFYKPASLTTTLSIDNRNRFYHQPKLIPTNCQKQSRHHQHQPSCLWFLCSLLCRCQAWILVCLFTRHPKPSARHESLWPKVSGLIPLLARAR